MKVTSFMLGDQDMKGYLQTIRPLKELAILQFDIDEYGVIFTGGVFYNSGDKWKWKKGDHINYVIFTGENGTPLSYFKLEEPHIIVYPETQSICGTFSKRYQPD